MWPFLRGKEKLVVKRMPITDLKLGDLILYKANNQLVCHRLVKKAQAGDGYLIYSRGDVSFGPPEPVDERMFLGKVIGILKNNKITDLEGIRHQVFNRINLFFLPLLNFIIKPCYKVLFAPLKREMSTKTQKKLLRLFGY